jgi:hypothetical protein
MAQREFDMKNIVFVNSIILEWERAYSGNYAIEVSDNSNKNSWTPLSSGNNGEKGKAVLNTLNTKRRFVRIYSYKGDHNYGISLFDSKSKSMETPRVALHPPFQLMEAPLLLILSLLGLPHKSRITSMPIKPLTATSIRDGQVRGPTTSALSWILVR